MKKPFFFTGLCLVATILLLIWGFGRTPQITPTPQKNYALIIDDDTGSFLMQLRKGIGAAAAEYDAQVTLLSNDAGQPLDAYAAIMLYLADPVTWIEQHAGQVSAPIVVIGKRVDGYSSVSTDDATTAYELLDSALRASSSETMAVLCDSEDARSAARGEAAVRWANRRGIALIDYAPGLPSMPEQLEIVVAMSSRATSALSELIRNGGFSGCVYGMDTGNNRARDIESGEVPVMLLEKPYAMGYLSMQKAADSIREEAKVEAITVSVLLADASNMYLPENVKQVFPLLQ